MAEKNERPFLEAEDDLNRALEGIGKDIKMHDPNEDRVANYTVGQLLEDLKIDEFEKLYVTTAAISNTPNMEKIPDEKVNNVKTVAEYKLEQMDKEEFVSDKDREKFITASNFYIIPRVAEQKFSVGNEEQKKSIDLYTINDVDGYCLYTIIKDNITISKNYKDRIEKYVKENYRPYIDNGDLTVSEVVEHFTPHTFNELYEKTSDEHMITMRFLPERVDEFARTKGIEGKYIGVKEDFLELREDNLLEENKIEPKNDLEEVQENNLEKTEEEPSNVIVKEKEDEKPKVR